MTAPIRILLVDDDEADRFITADYLDEAPGDFQLDWACCYSSALRMIEEVGFDVCLVDYQIGGETGIEFLAHARDRGVDCPMILLTGVGHRDIDLAASAIGAADFLDKSALTPTLLERAIRYAVSHSQSVRALSDQRRLLETILESIQAGIVAIGAEGSVLAQNSRFGAMLAELELQTEPEPNRHGESRHSQLSKMIADSGGVSEVESASGRTFELRRDPLAGGGHVLLAVDMSAQKSLQRDMLEAKQAAELANKTKSAFLAKVSHELRTPLNGVFGMAQLLRIGGLTADQNQNIDRLIESAMGLMALIEDLLDISVIEEGRFSLNSEAIRPAMLCNDAADIASAAARSADLEIMVDCRAPEDRIYVGDGKRIKQILVNFLGNAVKFTETGLIRVTADLLEGNRLRFAVIDDGPGISERDQAKIFDRFTQADAEVSRKHGGVGLGLSIASELVQQMQGQIGVKSEPGCGAEFWFEIPQDPTQVCISPSNAA